MLLEAAFTFTVALTPAQQMAVDKVTNIYLSECGIGPRVERVECANNLTRRFIANHPEARTTILPHVVRQLDHLGADYIAETIWTYTSADTGA